MRYPPPTSAGQETTTPSNGLPLAESKSPNADYDPEELAQALLPVMKILIAIHRRNKQKKS